MVSEASSTSSKHLASRAVSHFPEFFRGSVKANLQRASRYWTQRNVILSSHSIKKRDNGNTFQISTKTGVRIHFSKARAGRGRKRALWVQLLYQELVEEFNRLRKAGVKFSGSLLLVLAGDIIKSNRLSECGTETTDPRSGKLIIEHVTARWITHFMQANNIVSRRQTGKLMVSPAKRELIERSIAAHLGWLKRMFDSNIFDERDIYNADETHLVMHMHNDRTLALRGDTHIKYADVISGDEGMTLMVTMGGGYDSSFLTPFLIFKNLNSSYPIRSVPDDIPGITYRSNAKAWMNSDMFVKWLSCDRVFKSLPNGRKRILFVDNCTAHNITTSVTEALEQSNTELHFLPPNTTDLLQPADSFVIQNIKQEWTKSWEHYCKQMVEKNGWTDARTTSGRIPNPGKRYYMQCAADVVRKLSMKRDKDGILITRKAMIMCGLALNTNGVWEVRQLKPELQNIVRKYQEVFDEGKSPVNHHTNSAAEESDTQSTSSFLSQ